MNEKNYKILILFGGVSSEHDISCISAASVMKNIDIEKYDVTAIGITKDGKWMPRRVDHVLLANATVVHDDLQLSAQDAARRVDLIHGDLDGLHLRVPSAALRVTVQPLVFFSQETQLVS